MWLDGDVSPGAGSCHPDSAQVETLGSACLSYQVNTP